MVQTVLDVIALGYTLLWDAHRRPVGVQLHVGSDATQPVDAPHLLAVLREHWNARAPELLLSIQSPVLLRDVVRHGGADDPAVEIPSRWLDNPTLAPHLQAARERGLRLIGRGLPATGLTRLLLAHDAPVAEVGLARASGLPLIHERPASHGDADRLLAEPGTWAVAGWPERDALDALRGHALRPGRAVIEATLALLAADAALEAIEQRLLTDPVLSYRFLCHLNDPGTGLRQPALSVYHGMMVIGYASLEAWLRQQLEQATDDFNLDPVRGAIVTRAHLMARLLDAGEEHELRREVYLCGLLTGIDQLLDLPLVTALQPLHLSERMGELLLQGTGPYAPALEIARALQAPPGDAIHQLSELHDISMEEINRALLRTLSAVA